MDLSALSALIERIRSNEEVLRKDEQTTLAKAIYPLLAALGWRPEDDGFMPEYGIGTTRVDIALMGKGTPVLFLEAKRAGEPLHGHQQQLLQYAFGEGVPLAALTDGIRWWMYLPLAKGSWEQRRFFTIDLSEIPAMQAADHLFRLIGRAEVASDNALRYANELYAGREKKRRLLETIPLAWQALKQEADETLLDLFAEKVEGMCGYRPDHDALAQFLTAPDVQPQAPSKVQVAKLTRQGSTQRSLKPSNDRTGFTGKRAVSYTFEGKTTPVSTFKEVILQLVEELAALHGTERLLSVPLASRKGQPYVSREPNLMTEPRQIGSSDVWIESCLSAESVVRRSRQILRALGHDDSKFSVQAE